MLLDMEQLKTLVRLIDDGAYARAVEHWESILANADKCASCFYTPMAKHLRCAVCLEGHLTHAILSYTYPGISQETLGKSEEAIKAWIKTLQA